MRSPRGVSNISGIPLDDYYRQTGLCSKESREEMHRRVKDAAYEIIEKKGATYYAIALAVARITECIAGEENAILTVSTILEGEYGIHGTALSVPAKLSGSGIQHIPYVPFSDAEMKGLLNSAETMKGYISQLNL